MGALEDTEQEYSQMPRQRNIIITDISQLSPRDFILYRAHEWDDMGVVRQLGSVTLIRWVDNILIRVDVDDEYLIGRMIEMRVIMKITKVTYRRIASEQKEYRIEHNTYRGYRTGLFNA